jgi:hypothetical protein
VIEVKSVRGHITQSFGEELVVTSVRAIDSIRGAEPHDGADGSSLLSHGRVSGTVNQTFSGELKHHFLEGTDEVKLAEHRRQESWISFFPICLRRGDLNPGVRGL